MSTALLTPNEARAAAGLAALDSPFVTPFPLECRNCGNPGGPPWHSPRSKRCYFGEGPLWRRAARWVKQAVTR